MADVITHYITALRFLKARPGFPRDFARGLLFGSQGPDLFFFGGTRKSYVFACAIHDGSPAALFSDLMEDIANESELYRGYALGVLLHYFGDRNIHPYVGDHCRKNPSPYVHAFFESAIDACVYEREFGAPIWQFNYDAAFRRDRALALAARDFWSRRLGGALRLSYVRRCLDTMAYLTKIFSRAKPGTVKFAARIGKLAGKPEAALAHFRPKADARVMNDRREEWLSPTGPCRESVEDILARVLEDFARAYDALREGTYRFACTEPFSYGA